MPYTNEHAARLIDPGKFDKFRRTNGGKLYNKIEVPETIAIIWGHLKDTENDWAAQALRFPVKNWTEKEAKKWLADNEVKYIAFEPAEEKQENMEKEVRYFETKINFQNIPEEAFDKMGEKNISLASGHFLVFNQETELWKNYFEKIDPGALDDVLNDDVRVLFNHDSNMILARTTAKTAKISKDEKGGIAEWTFPETTYGKDLIVSIKRGDITGMSFGFTVDKQSWEEDKETGKVVRTILKLRRLYDVSPVTFPAYQQTDVALRAFDQYKAEKSITQTDEEEIKNKIKIQQERMKTKIAILKCK
jgi:HK97 family phage prohead protease